MNRNNTVHMSLDEAIERVDRGDYEFDPGAREGPSLGKEFWKDAWLDHPGPKTEETLAIDTSVVDWFKSRYPAGWRQHINDALHRHMDRETAKAE